MKKTVAYHDTREKLLAVGERLMHCRGFTALGLSEILATAKVPKGSFYHYFQSKEGFGVALLERYFSGCDAGLRKMRPDQMEECRLSGVCTEGEGAEAIEGEAEVGAASVLDARSRIMQYFDQWRTSSFAIGDSVHICLAVKLAAEVADLSEPMRCALVRGMDGITSQLAAAIRLAQEDGSVAAGKDADVLAQTLHTLWVGESLMSKVKCSLQPLDQAYQQTAVLL